MTRLRRLVFLGLAVALTSPGMVWVTFKPVRILAPQFNGVSCTRRVCVEDPSKIHRAEQLQFQAVAQVGRKLAALATPPLTVFCSTRSCYHSFGGGMERGATLLDWGVIIPPESWVPHIIEHEYIHMLQAQKLGLLGRMRTPDWFKEGQAFHVSQPPGYDFPAYARPLASRYRVWERQVGRKQVWQAIRKL